MALDILLQKFSRNKEPIRIIRYERGAYSGGVYYSEIQDEFSLWASVQPVTEDDIIATSDNTIRLSNSVKIFTVSPILLDNPATGQKADRIMIDGVSYEAKAQASYQHLSLGHFETICTKDPNE